MDQEQNETNQVRVVHKFHTSSTTMPLVLPMFATRWFQQNHSMFTSVPGMLPQMTTHVSCFTEIKHFIHGTIRCHPNYQGDGPWRDWVKATFKKTGRAVARSYLCQVICFVKKSRDDLQYSPDCVLLRTTSARSEDDYTESSVLFHRWRKDFDDNGDANVQMVPIDRIKTAVGVVDENPEMIEERHGVSQFLNTEEERNLLREDVGNRSFCKDIVWEVLPIDKWGGEFSNKATDRIAGIVKPSVVRR